MQRRHVVPIGLLAALVALVSCKAIHEMQGTLLDLQKVQQELAKALGRDEIRVFLNNGRFLSISVVNSPLNGLPADQKRAKALEIARLAYDSYPSRSVLQIVKVTFAVHRSYLGVFSYDNSMDSFSFEIPQLKAGTSAPTKATP